ncbi:response regulator transcription factor [Candidatus Symbiothrix dinenymphae]|uniref:response regulator transcription factor RprY n=1 Tax=Candidatus Symbiothrix dinenymphae TaxID=467085 RepID=UPI0006BF7835|nr:response regulator transcription factor [Candidatus Symbiothrix dinenymphae]GAP71490.1 two-component response regulator [Candidatus Symbiothrix dinenymphae]
MEEKVRVFMCEDDENLGLLLSEYLQAKGFLVDLFPDGEAGEASFGNAKYDLCILDVMMPKKDGFTLARDIRSFNANIPIIFLTAKNMQEDIVEGFKAGADDYLTKPFRMEELLLRIEAILRRVRGRKPPKEGPYIFGKYTFDWQKQTLFCGSNASKLTTKESDLLTLLCDNMNDLLDRDAALKAIWGENNYFNARSMDVYITKLRKLVKDDERIEILNIHSKGYKLIAPPADIAK